MTRRSEAFVASEMEMRSQCSGRIDMRSGHSRSPQRCNEGGSVPPPAGEVRRVGGEFVDVDADLRARKRMIEHIGARVRNNTGRYD